MGSGKGRPRRAFTDEYKAEVVALCRSDGRNVSNVSRDLGLTETAVRRWVLQADHAEGVRPERLPASEREELLELRKRVRSLEKDNDILKRAMAFFARETR